MLPLRTRVDAAVATFAEHTTHDDIDDSEIYDGMLPTLEELGVITKAERLTLLSEDRNERMLERFADNLRKQQRRAAMTPAERKREDESNGRMMKLMESSARSMELFYKRALYDSLQPGMYEKMFMPVSGEGTFKTTEFKTFKLKETR